MVKQNLPHTLCVVSTSDETTHCDVCLGKNCIFWDNYVLENRSFVR